MQLYLQLSRVSDQYLKQKYGDRVRDLEPTENSEMWLYGDKLSGPTFRARIVDKMFGSPKE